MTSDLGHVIFGSRKKIAISILHGSGAWSNTRLDTHCERSMERHSASRRGASVSRLMECLTPIIAASINTGGGGTTGNGGFGPDLPRHRKIRRRRGRVDRVGAQVPDHSQKRIRLQCAPSRHSGCSGHFFQRHPHRNRRAPSPMSSPLRQSN